MHSRRSSTRRRGSGRGGSSRAEAVSDDDVPWQGASPVCRRSTPILCTLPPPPPQHQPVRTLPSLQVTVGFHRGAGRMPPTPAREQWEPPPGWAPPSKPVTSWYDRGDRLAISAPPPEAAAAPAASPNLLEQFVALFSGVSASASASAAPRASAYKGKV